jgi:hypothetical protein
VEDLLENPAKVNHSLVQFSDVPLRISPQLAVSLG